MAKLFRNIFRSFLINFLRLTRPLSNLKNFAIILIAFYFSGAKFNLWLFIWGVFSLSLISSAIYVYNTINDLPIDQNNENKKHYAEAVKFFGEKGSFVIVLFLIMTGLAIGYYLGRGLFVSLLALLTAGFLYSSKYARFKEKIVLDILFGASLTFLLRFIAAWFIFSNSFPYLLPISALVFGKTAGYILYKSMDREYLLSQQNKNTITSLSLKSLFIFSLFFLTLVFLSVVLMFLNPIYFHIDVLGSLPIQALFLIPFAIPPIIIIFFQIIRKTKFKNLSLRIWGYVYMLLVIIVSYWIIK